MPAFKGYLDESGDAGDPQHAALSVAGYLGPIEGWAAFDQGWRRVLHEYGVPYLHMKELQSRRGAFRSWGKGDPEGDDTAERFFGELAGVIGRAKLEAFGATIVLADLRRFNSETGADIDPKALAIYACALGARERHPTDAMEFVLDRMAEGHAKVSLARGYAETDHYYPSVRNFPGVEVLPPDGPIGSVNTPGLQAADALAWEARKDYELKRPWFEGENLSPDSPGWGTSLFKWFVRERIKHMQKHKIASITLKKDLVRGSLSALADAAEPDGIVWTYRTLVRAHETRNGIWRPAPPEEKSA
jgi:hypothetical protein